MELGHKTEIRCKKQNIGGAEDGGQGWGGEKMLNPLLQSHLVSISMESLVIIWDVRLQILDLWNRYALSIYNR